MHTYTRIFSEKQKVKLIKPKLNKIKGVFGAGGFLSKLPYQKLLNEFGGDGPLYLIMDINQDLLTQSNSGKGFGKILDKMDDMRVDSKEIQGKLAITFPFEIHKKNVIINKYIALVTKYLNKI